RKQNPFGVPDPEGIRLNHTTQSLTWVSEGERTVRKEGTVLTDPAIIVSQTNGEWVDSFPLPPNFRMSATNKGPRNNGVLEALAFSADYKKLFVSLEEPLYEDGPRAGLFDTTGWVRICQYDAITKKQEAQWAYQIDPVVREPISESLFKVNGVTDILAINSHQLLVTERSFSTGRLGNNIRVYIAEFNGAEDISGIHSLESNPPARPLKKQLLLDMDHLGTLIDNVEGATFGPRLRNGKRSLLFITDNNFSSTQKNQLLLFEVQ
ncbi:MAG TPA: esterase-like activity of phytase family protein, partial [Flavisolibacter sp.]